MFNMSRQPIESNHAWYFAGIVHPSYIERNSSKPGGYIQRPCGVDYSAILVCPDLSVCSGLWDIEWLGSRTGMEVTFRTDPDPRG